ncbi:hypothetical protein JV269_003582 [Salmonella enterica]|nr:hypothetical protein [Salmonella enterica]
MIVILILCEFVESVSWQHDYIILLKKEVMEARAFISQALQILNDLSEIMTTMASCLKLRISLSVTLGYVQIR